MIEICRILTSQFCKRKFETFFKNGCKIFLEGKSKFNVLSVGDIDSDAQRLIRNPDSELKKSEKSSTNSQIQF